MADDTKNTKAADKQAEPVAADNAAKVAAPAAETAVPAAASTPAAPVGESVDVVALHPIYYQPGQPPYLPGTALKVCVTTARNWLAGGLVRLAAGVTIPVEANAGELAGFPVFPQSGTPAPASQG